MQVSTVICAREWAQLNDSSVCWIKRTCSRCDRALSLSHSIWESPTSDPGIHSFWALTATIILQLAPSIVEHLDGSGASQRHPKLRPGPLKKLWAPGPQRRQVQWLMGSANQGMEYRNGAVKRQLSKTMRSNHCSGSSLLLDTRGTFVPRVW